jgi:X-X-X-Leu-X-X-Gly heptad repeat protein
VGELPATVISVDSLSGELDVDTLTSGVATVTCGVATLTSGVDTLTPGSDTPILGSDTPTLGSDTPTLATVWAPASALKPSGKPTAISDAASTIDARRNCVTAIVSPVRLASGRSCARLG